jgi:class 3 adenylate cyclase
LCNLLTHALGLHAAQATIASGGKSRIKRIAIAGDAAALSARLEALARAGDGDQT